jgi:hypothetical protein
MKERYLENKKEIWNVVKSNLSVWRQCSRTEKSFLPHNSKPLIKYALSFCQGFLFLQNSMRENVLGKYL